VADAAWRDLLSSKNDHGNITETEIIQCVSGLPDAVTVTASENSARARLGHSDPPLTADAAFQHQTRLISPVKRSE
jgi:hypothetical protein